MGDMTNGYVPSKYEPRCHICFAPETLVRTEAGWREISDVQVGDRVLSSSGEFNRVSDVIITPYIGPLVSLRTSMSVDPIRVTPEHPVLKMTGHHPRFNGDCSPAHCSEGMQRESTVRPSSCDCGSCLKCYKREWARKSRAGYERQETTHELNWVAAGEISESDYVSTAGLRLGSSLEEVVIPSDFADNRGPGVRRKGPHAFKLTDEFLWIIGLYLAEGSCGTRGITFSLHRKEIEYQARVKSFFEEQGYRVRIGYRGNGAYFTISSSILSEWLSSWLGEGCDKKAIPSELLNLPADRLEPLIQGILDGDGCEMNQVLAQTSRILALQVQEWFIRSGLAATTSTRKEEGKKRVFITHTKRSEKNKPGSWIFGDTVLSRVRSIDSETYMGLVYNLSVENDPTYVVQNLVVHNCNSPLRNLVDMMACHAYRPTAIARHIQDVDEELCKKSFDAVRKSVERHVKEHLNYEQEALRKLVEEKAREAGIFADEAKATLVTRGAVLDRVVQKGWKQLSDEDSRVPYEFVLKAIELQEAQEHKAASLMVDQLTRQLNSIISAVKELVPETQWAAIVGRAREIHDTPVIELEPPRDLPQAALGDYEQEEFD